MIFKNYNNIISNGQTSELKKKREDVLKILTAALNSVDSYKAVEKIFQKNKIVYNSKKIDLLEFRNIYVVGFGKASVGMANAFSDYCQIKSGVIINNDSFAKINNKSLELVIGGHPIPNIGSINGTKKILEIVNKVGNDDLLIVLISGGGSSLLCSPRVSLKDLQKTTDLLLRCGADIVEINTIRKHLSKVKGGQLIKDVKGLVVSLIISDIVDDPVEFISSGPTSPDSTTFNDSKMILEKYNLLDVVPKDVKNVIEQGIIGIIDETLKNNDEIFKKVFNFIVANNTIACEAAFEKAKKIGYKPFIITKSLTGEAKDASKKIFEYILECKISKKSHFAFISCGETTVTVKGSGIGGRNQEFVLGAVEKNIFNNWVLASFATDGEDGNSDAAGAIADNYTIIRASENNLNPKEYLEHNNSYVFFKTLNDLFITGKTGTNVMDIQIFLI